MPDTPPAVEIHAEAPAEAEAVYHVIEQAFGSQVEVELVKALREQGAVVLSLVAVVDAQVVGHMLVTPVTLDTAPSYGGMVTIAPLAVLPAYQRRGIGAALLRAGLEHCAQLGYDAVVMLGHPGYYPRFGFVPASRYGLYCAYVEPGHDAFMALELRAGALDSKRGQVVFLPQFDAAT